MLTCWYILDFLYVRVLPVIMKGNLGDFGSCTKSIDS